MRRKWNPIRITPPDEMLEVIDEYGNEGMAQPTYYPFEIINKPGDERKPFGLRGTPVFFEDGQERWDGGWLIQHKNLTFNIKNIVGWRKPLTPNS